MNANPLFESWANAACGDRARHIIAYGNFLRQSDWGVVEDIVLWS
jgi:hypothetical protein